MNRFKHIMNTQNNTSHNNNKIEAASHFPELNKWIEPNFSIDTVLIIIIIITIIITSIYELKLKSFVWDDKKVLVHKLFSSINSVRDAKEAMACYIILHDSPKSHRSIYQSKYVLCFWSMWYENLIVVVVYLHHLCIVY